MDALKGWKKLEEVDLGEIVEKKAFRETDKVFACTQTDLVQVTILSKYIFYIYLLKMPQ